MTTQALYDAILTTGDRLEAALRARDLDGAEHLLTERAHWVAQVSGTDERPSDEAVERYRTHEVRVRDLLAAGLAEIRGALDEADRVADARGRYTARGVPSAQLDTAPR